METSRTMKEKHIDNFRNWRVRRQKLGIIPTIKSSFKKSARLSELIGVVLGDGNISQFPRTERMIILGNSNNPKFIERYAGVIEEIFKKRPTVTNVKNQNAVRISIYQKYIANRLEIPLGSRRDKKILIPSWIATNKRYLIAILRGLYEAEGSISINKRNYSYDFQFSNRNYSLLKFVSNSLVLLGFHPNLRRCDVRLRRKKEVRQFKTIIKFRVYK